METKKTNRGFPIVQFTDRYGSECSIQDSSLATECTIWFGVDDANPQVMASEVMENGTGWIKYPLPESVFLTTRMHLAQEQVKEILPVLQRFAETGTISE